MTTHSSCRHRRPAGQPFTASQREVPPTTLEEHAHTLAVFAHELREPLGSILLAARALNEETPDPATHREMSDLIERQGRYLGRLIDGALKRSPGNGQCGLHLEWFDLVPVAREAGEAVSSLMKHGRHRFDVSLPLGPVHLLADPLRVQQVLINLLANAAKYTPPGGSVHLGIAARDGEVVIEVSDNGIGMTPSVLARVFDLFAQGATHAPATGYSGLGVGLALVRSLVEGHGGTVQASSRGPGAGSSFVVRLPVFGGPEPMRMNAAAPAEQSVPQGKCSASDFPMLDA